MPIHTRAAQRSAPLPRGYFRYRSIHLSNHVSIISACAPACKINPQNHLFANQAYWVGANTETTHYSGRNAPEDAEYAFNTMLNKELMKFEKE